MHSQAALARLTTGNKKGPQRCGPFNFIGAGDRSRTCDLRITNALLYLLSYTGARWRIIGGYAVGLKPVRQPPETAIHLSCHLPLVRPRSRLAVVAFEVVLDLTGQLFTLGSGHFIAFAGLGLELAGKLVAFLPHEFVFATGWRD